MGEIEFKDLEEHPIFEVFSRWNTESRGHPHIETDMVVDKISKKTGKVIGKIKFVGVSFVGSKEEESPTKDDNGFYYRLKEIKHRKEKSKRGKKK